MTDPYRAGYEAFKNGEPLSNSPRLADLEIGRQWRAGWLHAKAGGVL